MIQENFPLDNIDFETILKSNPNRIETDEEWARELGAKQQDPEWDWDREIPVVFVIEQGNGEKVYEPASGIHRLLGRKLAGFDTYKKVDVRTGTNEDFLIAAIASNKDDDERKKLSPQDKRKVLHSLFESMKFWTKTVDSLIALTKFSRSFIFDYRREYLEAVEAENPQRAAFLRQALKESQKERPVTRKGTTYKMDASGLGKTTTPEDTDSVSDEPKVTPTPVPTLPPTTPPLPIEKPDPIRTLAQKIAEIEGVTIDEFLNPSYWVVRYAQKHPQLWEGEQQYCGEPRIIPMQDDPENQLRLEPGDRLWIESGSVYFNEEDSRLAIEISLQELIAKQAIGIAA